MQSTFEKILKEGERKGYFRFHNDGARIEYLPSGHKENLNDPEEKVRAEYYFDLIEKYGYPAARIGLEVEMPDRTPERYADIVIYENDAQTKPYIVVECKKDGISDAEFEQSTKQAIANARVLHAPFANCVAGNTLRAMETAVWNDKEPEKAIFAGYMIRFKINPQKAIPKYIFCLTQTRYYELWKNLIQRPSGRPTLAQIPSARKARNATI